MWLRATLSRPAMVIASGLFWGLLFFSVGTYFTQDDPVTSGATQVPLGIAALIICVLFYGVALVAGIVLLFKRNFLTGACWIAVACSIWLPFHALSRLNARREEISDERSSAGPHREIADLYRRRQSEFVFDPSKLSAMGPHLVSFGTQCHPHPSNSCECWVVWDPRHVSGIEDDIGRRHKPKSSIFPTETFWPQFGIVDVKRIDSDAYSVLACGPDPDTVF